MPTFYRCFLIPLMKGYFPLPETGRALVVRVLRGLMVLVSCQVSADDNAMPQDVAPDFSLPLLAQQSEPIPEQNRAKRKSLGDFAGKVVYLNFWASWCGPCRIEIPLLNELRKELKDHDFEVIGINVDANPEDAGAFLQRYPVDFTVLSDPMGKTSRLYGLSGFPSGFLINQKGLIVEATQGFHKGYIDHLRGKIAELAPSP